MENNDEKLRDYFISVLRGKTEYGFQNVFFGWEKPHPGKSFATHNHPRILLTVNGCDHLEISDSGVIREITLNPPDILFTVTNGWTINTGRKTMATISIVFFENFLRIVENRYENTRITDKFWYHTSQRVSETTFFLLRALEDAAHKKVCERDILLLKALLLSVVQELENDTQNPSDRAWYTYQRIINYATANFNVPINRATVAGDLKINECHISKLFKRYSSENFNSMLKRMRMNHAVNLLSSSELNISEVAENCGFENTDYFIKAFKAYYKITPTRFRQRSRQ